MLKKLALTLTVILVFATVVPELHAQSRRGDTRIGLGLGTPNTVLVVRPHPFDFKVGYDFTEGNQFVYLAGDLRFVNLQPLAEPVHFSLGFGGYMKFYMDSEAGSDDFFEGGLRLPVGLSLLLLDDFFEIFVEVSPGIDLYPKPQFSDDPVQAWLGFTLDTTL